MPLGEIEDLLPKNMFFRCNHCYLVNLKYVSEVNKFEVTIGTGDKLQISHPRKKQFMNALMNYLGERL